MNGPIETLLFDFGGTLDADGVAWKERFYALYRADGLDMANDAFAVAYYAADAPLVGILPPTTDLAGTVHALTVNLERELSRCRAGKISEGRSDRFRLGIVSNFYGNLEAVCEGAGLCNFFKVMVDSCCVGFEKPDPPIFREALERLDATTEKTVLIGDSLRRDREGARRM